ncbi:TPA: OsmC family protein [Pseudomonas aeruginosa]
MATQVVNASLGTIPYRVTLGDDSHQWLSDVPAALGGADSGPSPHEILLSALGACTAITVAMYAQRKEWPLEGIDVQLNIVEERTKPEPFTHIRRDIRLAGDLDAEQRQRLLEIANACPIHRVLSGEVSVSSQLRD